MRLRTRVRPVTDHARRIVLRGVGSERRIVLRTSAGETSGSGVTDHGGLTGLGDDDHGQYALADGTRGDFATTAQGDLADTAVQPSALSDAITAHTAATDPHGDRAYTDAQIIASLANFVAGAPGILDTWLEMVAAIQTDQSGLAALTTVVAGKLAKASNLSDLADAETARGNLGLGSAATTAASAYEVAGAAAAAQAAAIAAAATDATTKADAKVADAINDGTTTVAPSQNAVYDALALKADLASPALTGDPTAPTQAQGNNSTRLATTAYVQTEAGLLVPKSTVTTKGDLIVGTGSGAITRRGVGSNGQVLTADSTQTDGVKWATPSTGSSGGGGTFRYRALQGRYLNPNVSVLTVNQAFTGRVAYVAIDVTTEQAWDAIAIYVATAETDATLELGLVADDPLLPGYPGGLIESVTVGLGSVGPAVGVFASPHMLQPGTYWLASVLSAPANTVRIAVSSNSAAPGTVPYTYSKSVLPGATDTFGAAGYLYTGASIPASAPAGMTMNRYLPLPGLRAASW